MRSLGCIVGLSEELHRIRAGRGNWVTGRGRALVRRGERTCRSRSITLENGGLTCLEQIVARLIELKNGPLTQQGC